MARVLMPMSMLSLLSIGAIFGFFYAWVCSTMWGLDATAPRVAITAALSAIRFSFRRFLTPVILALTAFIAAREKRARAAILFAASAVIYLAGALLITAMFNVPMNEALAQVSVPTDSAAAADIWQGYSAPWQFWNTLRTPSSGLALLLTGLAIYSLKPETT